MTNLFLQGPGKRGKRDGAVKKRSHTPSPDHGKTERLRPPVVTAGWTDTDKTRQGIGRGEGGRKSGRGKGGEAPSEAPLRGTFFASRQGAVNLFFIPSAFLTLVFSCSFNHMRGQTCGSQRKKRTQCCFITSSSSRADTAEL